MSDSELDDQLEELRDSFDTTLLLANLDFFPAELRDDVLELHTLAMAVVNNDDNTKAAKLFAAADDMSYELYDRIDKYTKLKKLIDSISKHDPGLDYDPDDDDED